MSAMPGHITTDATKAKLSAALKGRTNRTPAQIAKLRRMWDEGLSTAEMGRQMGGWTKSTVQGLCHRQGFPPRPSPIVLGGVKQPTLLRGPVTLPLFAADRIRLVWPAPKVAPVFHADARTGCQFVTDATRMKQRFCDAVRVSGKPYCPQHCSACYRQPDESAAA